MNNFLKGCVAASALALSTASAWAADVTLKERRTLVLQRTLQCG